MRRMSRLFPVPALVLCMLCVAGTLHARLQEDPEEVLDNVRQAYDRMHDVSCAFHQTVVFGVTHNEQALDGTLVMKKGNRYRLETEDQAIVTDGKTVWSYSKATKQVLIDNYREDPRSFTPDKILLNVDDRYTVSLLSPESRDGRNLVVLKLIPRDKMSGIKWMKVWVDEKEWHIRRAQMQDVSENLTTYVVSSLSSNTSVPDSTFTFVPPAGVDIVDLR